MPATGPVLASATSARARASMMTVRSIPKFWHKWLKSIRSKLFPMGCVSLSGADSAVPSPWVVLGLARPLGAGIPHGPFKGRTVGNRRQLDKAETGRRWASWLRTSRKLELLHHPSGGPQPSAGCGAGPPFREQAAAGTVAR